jgi:hypothetical protein
MLITKELSFDNEPHAKECLVFVQIAVGPYLTTRNLVQENGQYIVRVEVEERHAELVTWWFFGFKSGYTIRGFPTHVTITGENPST